MIEIISRIPAARWLKFNLVGAVGIGVQLGALALMTRAFRMEYLLATAIAVEAAVLHNFLWHEHFTWADRTSPRLADVLLRLLRFNTTTGTLSIAGNLLLMRALVGGAHLPPIAGNVISITACSFLNFLVSDRWVFRRDFDS